MTEGQTPLRLYMERSRSSNFFVVKGKEKMSVTENMNQQQDNASHGESTPLADAGPSQQTPQVAEQASAASDEAVQQPAGTGVEGASVPAEPAPSAPVKEPAQVLAELAALPSDESRRALADLVREQGIDGLPVLALLARQGSDMLFAAALETMVALRSQASADLLANIGADRSVPKARAKEARRALYRLNLQGIKAAPVVAPPPAVAEPDKVYACLATAIDREGGCSIYVVKQNRFGTLRLASFVLNEEQGVVDGFGADPCSLTMWKRLSAELMTGTLPAVPVELAFCRRQVETAEARNHRTNTPLPDGYYALIELLEGPSQEQPRPAELHPDAIRANEALLPASSKLVSLPECRSWVLLPPEQIRPHAQRLIAELRRQEQIEAQRQDELPVTDLGQIQREGIVVRMALTALFDGARRACFQTRLEYTADLFWRSGKLEEAQWAMAAALALAPESTLPVEDHPFLWELMRTSLDFAAYAEETEATLQDEEDQEAAEPEVTVDEGGFIRHKSGLLLPR